MINDILERLKKVKDFRQNQGKRHKIWVILSIIVLSILTGNSSSKQIEMFSNNNQEQLINILVAGRHTETKNGLLGKCRLLPK